MPDFGTADAARLTGLPQSSIRAMARARYVAPTKGARGALRFSFQDLVVLRAARGLLAARMSPRRIGEALRALRQQLPAAASPRGFSVAAVGDKVVVREGGIAREARSGQLVLAFEVVVDHDEVAFIDDERPVDDSGSDCERAFEAALDLEENDVDAAIDAYAACVSRHAHNGARTNLGRLLHLQGRITEAVALYRGVDEPDADVLYNLGVALEDLGQPAEAIEAYERALALDASLADAHHNVARLWREAGEEQRAVRHWNAYRRLSAS